MNDDARLARWTAPLATPVAEPRQHPLFELIRSETAKLESPTAGATDWCAVLRAADQFLTDVGRDVFVGSALASALTHRENLRGAAIGTALLARLVADPSAAPTRTRARSNAIATFLGRLDPFVDGAKEARPTLELLDEALRELRSATDAWGDDAPAVASTQERVRRALAALPIATPPIEAPTPSAPPPVFVLPPPAPPTSSPIDAASALPDRPEQVPAFVRRAATQIVSAAALVRTTSTLDADALRWTLVALYLPITSAPETTKDARTALTAPPKLVLEGLEKRSASAPPESIVKETLGALERSRFALDLHVHLSRALDRAGASAAAAIHRHEVGGLLARLPELLDREFADGTPFASPSARTFFDAWTAKAQPAPIERAEAVGAVEEIDTLVRAGRIADALALGSRLRHGASSGRDRFAATLATTRAAELARALPLAVDLVAALVEDVDRHGLESWEPGLASEVLRTAIRLGDGSDPASRSLFARLARIDARAALELSASIHATPAKHGR